MTEMGELDRIGAEGAALHAGMGPGDLDLSAPAAPPGPSHAERVAMWAAIPATFGSILAIAMPEMSTIYTDAACNRWGEAMLPVAKKHGWDSLDDLPEFVLLLASLPFLIGTGQALKRRRQGQAPGELAPTAGKVPASSGPSPNAGVV